MSQERAYFESEAPAVPAEPTAPTGAMISKTGDLPVPFSPAGSPGLPDDLYDDRALIVLALRLDGYTTAEICEKTKLSLEAVRYALRKARQGGKLRDVIDLVDNECVPQAVENLITKLREGNFGEAEIQVLKGRGVFQNFNKNKNEGVGGAAGIPSLQINFINPQAGGGALPTVIVNSESGQVFGEGRED